VRGVICVAAMASIMGAFGCARRIAEDGKRPRSSVPVRVHRLAEALDQAFRMCPERVWPGSSRWFRAGQVLIVDKSAPVAYLWNDQRGKLPSSQPPRLTAIDLAALAPNWSAGDFTFGVLTGAPTLGIVLPGSTDRALIGSIGSPFRDHALQLALHEGFHLLSGQQGWPAARMPGSRSLPFPDRWGRRYLRGALQRALADMLRHEAVATIGAVAFWQERLRAEYPAWLERARTTDIVEGTAQYAGLGFSTVLELGCGSGDGDIRRAMLIHALDVTSSRAGEASHDAYALGVLAGLALTENGRRGWHRLVENGATPVEVLVAGIRPEAREDDPVLVQVAQEATRRFNERCETPVASMLAQLKSPDYVRIPVKQQWKVGSFRAGAFITLGDEPEAPEAMLDYKATFIVPDRRTLISVSQESVIAASATACETASPQLVLRVPVSALEADRSEDGFSVRYGSTTFRGLSGTMRRDREGLLWLCPATPKEAVPAPTSIREDGSASLK
jgi:hypothetical protein